MAGRRDSTESSHLGSENVKLVLVLDFAQVDNIRHVHPIQGGMLL